MDPRARSSAGIPHSPVLSVPGSHRSFPGAPELPGVRLDPARVPVPEARLPPGCGHADPAPALPEEILLQHGPLRPARHRGLLLHPALMQPSCKERLSPPKSSFQLNSSFSRARMDLSPRGWQSQALSGHSYLLNGFFQPGKSLVQTFSSWKYP